MVHPVARDVFGLQIFKIVSAYTKTSAETQILRSSGRLRGHYIAPICGRLETDRLLARGLVRRDPSIHGRPKSTETPLDAGLFFGTFAPQTRPSVRWLDLVWSREENHSPYSGAAGRISGRNASRH